MSSNNHVDPRASKRRKLKDGILDARGTTRASQPSHGAPKPKTAPPPTNHLLACYLAYEFLSRGTLFGRGFGQSHAEPMSRAAEPDALQVYADVSGLLKQDDVHLPGIVNPSQLARWIGM